MAISNNNRLSKRLLGQWGEKIAQDWFTAQGYAILENNWKMNHYEVDLIVMKDDRVIFVEVKTRFNDQADPVEAVNKRKRARIIASANVYLQRFNFACDYQFDIISIVGSPEGYTVEHIPDAFFPKLKRYNFSFKL